MELTNVRWWRTNASQHLASTAFLEIEDSILARSERMVSHTHLSHLMSPALKFLLW